MSLNITISAKNADELDTFNPVVGEWYVDGSSEDRTREGIEQSVCNWMDAEYDIQVSVFHADGREIVDDMPASGTFVAVRV